MRHWVVCVAPHHPQTLGSSSNSGCSTPLGRKRPSRPRARGRAGAFFFFWVGTDEMISDAEDVVVEEEDTMKGEKEDDDGVGMNMEA